MAEVLVLVYFLAGSIALVQAQEHSLLVRSRTWVSRQVKRRWTMARMVGLAALCLPGPLLNDGSWLFAALVWVGGNAVFTALFRYAMNTACGWDPFYLGSTSLYDVEILHWVTGDPRHLIYHNHQALYKVAERYRSNVHLSGRVAYGIEVTCAVLCAVVALLI